MRFSKYFILLATGQAEVGGHCFNISLSNGNVPFSVGVLESTLFFTYVSLKAICSDVDVDVVSTWIS